MIYLYKILFPIRYEWTIDYSIKVGKKKKFGIKFYSLNSCF